MSVKPEYSYRVGGFKLDSREAARMIQRSLRREGLPLEDTLIVQRTITEKVVR
jgi:hypothetical protein